MSKPSAADPDMPEEFDFSNAKRGVYYKGASKGVKVFHVTDEEDQARQRKAEAGQPRKPRKAS